MGLIIAGTISKGGVGKTSCNVNLAYLAHERGYKVCLIDLDPQSNATANFITDPLSGVCVASDLFEEEALPKVHAVEGGISLIPANEALLGVEQYEIEAAADFVRNVRALAESFDLVVIDTPPTLGFCILAPLMAADFAFSPLVPDSYSASGVNTVMERIGQVRQTTNPDLQYLGVLINKFNRVDYYQRKNVADLKADYPELIQPHDIGMRSAVTAAAQECRPVWKSAKSGARRAAAKEFKAALGWMLDTMKLTAPSAKKENNDG